ncbi:DNA sulfur modification protein DndB [Neobacillus vireti]|uniref:DNA sulfur modification protein DndB n=1 Tax=Neobacillus vireti TaxID=220686 RepID=UPI002FFD87CA
MKQDRKVLEENLINVIQTSKIKTKRKLLDDIKLHLAQYDIVDVQGWLNDPNNRIPELDIRELFLLTEQIFAKTGDLSINPEDFFTPAETRESRQFSAAMENKQDEMSFPITFTNATVVGNSAYMVTMNIQTITKMLDNGLIYYNYETQREARYVKRRDTIVIEPTLNKDSVRDITEHLLQSTLVPTVLVFNCETRTTTDPSGEELIYNSKNLELTITKSTRVSITDGFHRITASRNALQINPDLEFNFAVLVTNYSTKKAQQYMAQISKSNPVSKTRIQELEASRLSDNVVQQLKEESELKGRISQTNRIHSLNRELVTYNVLADTIDEEFKMDTKLESLDVADFLTSYFDFLIGSYPDEFINHVEDTRKTSLINDNNFFIGYIVLARKLFEAKLKAKEIRKYIKDIDFSRSNPLWRELKILDENGNLLETTKVRKAIKQYFENIEIEAKV